MTGRCHSGVDDEFGWKMMGVGDAVDDAASARSEEPQDPRRSSRPPCPTAPRKNRNEDKGQTIAREGRCGGANMSTGSSAGRERKGLFVAKNFWLRAIR